MTIANVYNRTTTQRDFRALLSPLEIPEKFLSAGDFNAYHGDWDHQDGIKANTAGNTASQWAAENGLVVHEHHEPTQTKGYAIDLVFSNLKVSSRINRLLKSGSAHQTIETTILNPEAPPRAPKAKFCVSPDGLETFAGLIQQHAPRPDKPRS